MKLFIIPHPPEFEPIFSCPRTEQIVREGFAQLPVELVDSENAADYNILYYVPHTQSSDKYNTEFIKQYDWSKTVVIDSSDENNTYYFPPQYSFLYFKRSLYKWNSQFDREYIQQHENVRQWNYSVMSAFNVYYPIPYQKRPIDIGCYLRHSEGNRNQVLHLMEQLRQQNPGLNMKIGPCTEGGRSISGKVYVDENYLGYLQQTKINIVCQPPWTGCSREFESFSQNCLTFIDKPLLIPHDNPVNHEHYVEYMLSNVPTLMMNIQEYLQNPIKAEKVADAGYKWAMATQQSKHRCAYIIQCIFQKERNCKEIALV